jgi:hypothetical protein
MDWIDLAQGRKTLLSLVDAQNAGNFLTSSSPVGFPRMTVLHGVSLFSQSVSQPARKLVS